MELLVIVPILLIISAILTCGEPTYKFNHDVAMSKASYGNILKPPPLPPSHQKRPPFHGQRIQRQNVDYGYQYPPPPPPPPAPPASNFKLPSPFYKPMGFNFVPPPQPFLTTPSPSVFQKLQSWLFPPSQPSQLTTGPSGGGNISPYKKECNPCNLVPWIPVIRYNPPENLNLGEGSATPNHGTPALSYGQPSVTAMPNYIQPKPFYGPPKVQSSPFNSPSLPSTTYGPPISSYGAPSVSYGPPSFSTPSSTYGPPKPTDVEVFQAQDDPSSYGQRLPKVSYPTGFKNSYGEPVTITVPYNEIYPISATAAESSKLKPEIVPADINSFQPNNLNSTFSKPAPFTQYAGRGIIHTLQPIALPNLSASPLPPIFNARPFRTNIPTSYGSETNSKPVNIVSSIPIAEFTHSIEFPPKFTQSPIIEIDVGKKSNKTKGFRIIPFEVDNHQRDASSQASEAHTASANNYIQDASFESTGTATDNDFYDSISTQTQGKILVPSNHRPEFADLRGMTDASDENGLRSEHHLQAIDSPILYLRPGAPHKEFNSLFGITTTSVHGLNEFEIYDDILTSTIAPSTVSDVWSIKNYSDNEEETQKQKDNNRPKVLQIIIPYTTGNNQNSEKEQIEQNSTHWVQENEDYGNQGRKVPSYPAKFNTATSYSELYITPVPSTVQPTESITEYFEPTRLTAAAILNDLYDVKEPPFDIVALQHNIDGWTEQEYSTSYKLPQKISYKGKYAKQIPEEYLTTPYPSTMIYTTPNYNSYYDNEGAGSMQHTMKENEDSATQRSAKEYNYIERHKEKKTNLMKDSKLKPHIYTAASSFRSISTTTPPWGQIQTSISPLTKEKVYVVTARPWREETNKTLPWFEGSSFEAQKTPESDNIVSASDNLPFKSPRFTNRPIVSSLDASAESMRTDSSYSLGKSWHQSINALELSGEEQRNSMNSTEGDQAALTNADEVTTVQSAETSNKEEVNMETRKPLNKLESEK